MNELLARIDRSPPAGSYLPVLSSPARLDETVLDIYRQLGSHIETQIASIKGVLLPSFSVPSAQHFNKFAATFGNGLLKHEFSSILHSRVNTGIYTSTEYPAHQPVLVRNDQAYTDEWSMKIWFHCVTTSLEDGETPIADSRRGYQSMPEAICPAFEPVHDYCDIDVPWQKVFNTHSRIEVETFCYCANIRWEWADGQLHTEQLYQSIETHPCTADKVWFNQSLLFNFSNLQAEVRELLEYLLGIENVPRNVTFADGMVIPDTVFDDIRNVLVEDTVALFLAERRYSRTRQNTDCTFTQTFQEAAQGGCRNVSVLRQSRQTLTPTPFN